jgi:ComF family protein
MVLLRQMIGKTLDTLFPPRCFGCGEMVEATGNLCGSCWSAVDFISAPLCRRCGTPFELDAGAESDCMPCLQSPPPYDSARAVFRYEGDSRRLITGYKYHDRTLATPMFARWLARAGAAQLAQAEVIVPVPLHPWRLLRRRYNQSALLAAALGRLCDKPVQADALRRTRHTTPQAGLTREQRLRNVEDAFAITLRRQPAIAGRRVLLVDDVLTTGATLDACTQALKRAGAQEIYVLVLARTTLDDV